MNLFKKLFKKRIDEEIRKSIKELEKPLNADIKYKAVFGLARFILLNSHFIGIETDIKDCISKSMCIFASNLIDDYEKYERMKLYWSMEFAMSNADYDWYMEKYNEMFMDSNYKTVIVTSDRIKQ